MIPKIGLRNQSLYHDQSKSVIDEINPGIVEVGEASATGMSVIR